MRYLTLNLPYSRRRESWIRTGTWCPTFCHRFSIFLTNSHSADSIPTTITLIHHGITFGSSSQYFPIKSTSRQFWKLLPPCPFVLGSYNGPAFQTRVLKAADPKRSDSPKSIPWLFSHCLIRKISILLKLNCYLGCVESVHSRRQDEAGINGYRIAKNTALQHFSQTDPKLPCLRSRFIDKVTL